MSVIRAVDRSSRMTAFNSRATLRGAQRAAVVSSAAAARKSLIGLVAARVVRKAPCVA